MTKKLICYKQILNLLIRLSDKTEENLLWNLKQTEHQLKSMK